MIENESEVIARSLWSATCNRASDTAPLEGNLSADVAIVGAGYTGLSTAVHLAERGVSVVVLEAESLGWGASGRNGGQVIPGLKEDPDTIEQVFGADVGGRMVRLAGTAPDLVFGLIERLAIACDAVRQGWIQPAHGPKPLAALESRVEQWARRGAPIEILSSQETARLIGTETYVGGALDRRGGGIHPLNYALGLAEAAARLGVAIHSKSRVTALSRDAGRWRVDTAGGSVRAEQVMLCTNGYTDALVDRLRRSVVPVRSVQVASAPLSQNVKPRSCPKATWPPTCAGCCCITASIGTAGSSWAGVGPMASPRRGPEWRACAPRCGPCSRKSAISSGSFSGAAMWP
jgi:glycine/D-amino acid oxidase-like deaminating enzyme